MLRLSDKHGQFHIFALTKQKTKKKNPVNSSATGEIKELKA